jgi:hypothetical protein
MVDGKQLKVNFNTNCNRVLRYNFLPNLVPEMLADNCGAITIFCYTDT